MKTILSRARELLPGWFIDRPKIDAGLLILSVLLNAVCAAALVDARVKLRQAEQVQIQALEQLTEVAFQTEREKRGEKQEEKWENPDPATQTAVYETVGAYRYIGECTLTSYCPCEICCGPWADGLTATGLPAGPGIVAVDPDVIPLGSTVVIDGVRYLAADTGVTGLWVDICTNSHQQAKNFGRQTAAVWIELEETGGK